jgi:glycosyltransferase XagB
LSVGYELNITEGSKSVDPVVKVHELPVLPNHLLRAIFTRLAPAEKELALRHKLLPIAWLPERTIFAAVEGDPLERATANNIKPVARIDAKDFQVGVKRYLGKELLEQATENLKDNKPEFSAHRRFMPWQIFWFGVLTVVYLIALANLPFEVSFAFTSFFFSLFFLGVVALRLMCVMNRGQNYQTKPRKLKDEQLPTYSVLVPLYRETRVLQQLLAALNQLDYPQHLLDIKLILEENDITMHRAIAAFELPSHFEVIVVPSGKPQTKPRALNYALQFSRGELLTIYDAEDMPEPDQLRKAAAVFATGPQDLACLQVELTFYNANENWITRQFAIEYAVLFQSVLPCLAREGMPLPLGGTSNHFRTEILRHVGAWDPFNVTEDADLGLRLARLGYQAQILDSKTFEEANTEFGNWISQRARWLKGFLQTWLVHMRRPDLLPREIGWDGIWALQAICFGTIFSSTVHPIFNLLIGYHLWQSWQTPFGHSVFTTAIAGMSIVVSLIGYGASLYAGYLACKRNGQIWWGALLTMPLYWLLMGVAAWLSLWQFIVAPFQWNKTRHGISTLTTVSKPYFAPVTVMPAGPKMITKITGKKNRIIGTVSFGGRAAAFFSASAMRSLRFSWAKTRNAEPKGVP